MNKYSTQRSKCATGNGVSYSSANIVPSQNQFLLESHRIQLSDEIVAWNFFICRSGRKRQSYCELLGWNISRDCSK